MMRPSTTAAPMPWRGVGIGVFEIQRFVTASYISVALKMRKGASPPKTRMRSGSAAAARPPRADGSGGATPARWWHRGPRGPGVPRGIVLVDGRAGHPAQATSGVAADDVEPAGGHGGRRVMGRDGKRGPRLPLVRRRIVDVDAGHRLTAVIEAADREHTALERRHRDFLTRRGQWSQRHPRPRRALIHRGGRVGPEADAA